MNKPTYSKSKLLINIFLTILILGVISVFATNYVNENGISSPSFTSANVTINDSGMYYNDGNSYRGVSSGNKYNLCFASNIYEFAYKSVKWSSGCDYVCYDDDCGDNINSIGLNIQNGSTILLQDIVEYPIKTTIQLKPYGVNLQGAGGIIYATKFYDSTTRLKWTGADGGLMINITGDQSSFQIQDLYLDGNYKAGGGIYKADTGNDQRAGYIRLNGVSMRKINGTYIDLSNQGGEDSSFYDVYLRQGGYGSIGLKNPSTELKYFGGAIAEMNISAVYLSRDTAMSNTGATIRFIGTIFAVGSNSIDIILNGTNVKMDGFSCESCWFDSSKERIHSYGTGINMTFIDFTSPTFYAHSVFNLTGVYTSLNIYGGKTINNQQMVIITDSNNTVVSMFNHGNSNSYTFTGVKKKIILDTVNPSLINDGGITQLSLGSSSATNDVYLNMYRASSQNNWINLYTGSTLDWRIGESYDLNNNYVIKNGSGTVQYQMLPTGQVYITNLTGSGNDYVCVGSDGRIYRSDLACA